MDDGDLPLDDLSAHGDLSSPNTLKPESLLTRHTGPTFFFFFNGLACNKVNSDSSSVLKEVPFLEDFRGIEYKRMLAKKATQNTIFQRGSVVLIALHR